MFFFILQLPLCFNSTLKLPYPGPRGGMISVPLALLLALWAGVPSRGQVAHTIVDPSANWTTDYVTAPAPDSPDYDRCKTTHRCNRASMTYAVDEGRYLFYQQRFKDGRQENADLFLNFEDWKAGTMGLGVDHVRWGACGPLRLLCHMRITLV